MTLLKFKKAIPTSLIRFRSNERNGDELVPVYTNDNIPSDAHFIPTPKGVSDYKNVQAVAVPNIFYEGLLLHGMDNLESLASLLNGAEKGSNDESTLTVAEAATSNANEADTENACNIDDEMLNIPENENMELSNLLNRSYADLHATWAENLKTPPYILEKIPFYLYTIVDANQALESRKASNKSEKKNVENS